MSEIFNSAVDGNLQSELTNRALAGKVTRTTQDIAYMVEKIANVTLIPYKTPNATTREVIKKGILGGVNVRGKNYKPAGILDPQSNREYRTPPVITSAEIAIGDHSMGLLNTATINLLIPNPNTDLNLIEAIYFRPGRSVELIIEHPDSAIAGINSELTEIVTPSLNKIEESIPVLRRPDNFNEKYRTLNKVTFEGLITSFTFDYNSDLSVNATLSMRGTSNVYTEISLIINDQKVEKKKATDPEKPAADVKITEEPDTFYTNLLAEFQTLQAEKIEKEIKPTLKIPEAKAPEYQGVIRYPKPIQNFNSAFGVFGVPNPQVGLQRYITMGWLIEYINQTIMSKLTAGSPPAIPTAYIVFNEQVTKSRWYNPVAFVSPDPLALFYSNKTNRTYVRENEKPLIWFETLSLDEIQFANGSESYITSSILINLEVIKNIHDALLKNKKFTVNNLLSELSNLIKSMSGESISLKLITHPENQKCLLWYDENYVAKPFPIPMAANDVGVSLVRDFSFSAKLTDSAAHLSYALNQDLSSLTESEIAPFLAYMYAYNENPEFAEIEPEFGNAITKVTGAAVESEYSKNHTKYLNELALAISTFAGDITNVDKQNKLQNSLSSYIKYPTPGLKDAAILSAPVFPFDTEFTIDGVNGFKYGDNIAFPVLPVRYTSQTTFMVINVTHTVSAEGVWTTTIRSVMRPKFS